MVSRLEKLPVPHDPALPVIDLETSTPLQICQTVADNFLHLARVINETYGQPFDIEESFELLLVATCRILTVTYCKKEGRISISSSDSFPSFSLSGTVKDGCFNPANLTDMRARQRQIILGEKTLRSDSTALLGLVHNHALQNVHAIKITARPTSTDIEGPVPLFDNSGQPTDTTTQTITRRQTIDYLIQQIAPPSAGAQA